MPKNAKEGTLGAEAENAGKETEKDTKWRFKVLELL